MTERPAQLFFTTSDYPHASKHTNVIASSRIRLWRSRKSSEDNVGHIKLRFWWRRTYSYHMKMAANNKPIKPYPNMETFKLNERHRWARRLPSDTLEKFCNERLMLTRLINKRTHIYTHKYVHIHLTPILKPGLPSASQWLDSMQCTAFTSKGLQLRMTHRLQNTLQTTRLIQNTVSAEGVSWQSSDTSDWRKSIQ